MLRASFIAKETATPLDQGCVKVDSAVCCGRGERLALGWRVGHDIDASCCRLIRIAVLLGQKAGREGDRCRWRNLEGRVERVLRRLLAIWGMWAPDTDGK